MAQLDIKFDTEQSRILFLNITLVIPVTHIEFK